ncbi:MAG: two-component system chemotaxis sensor kinase CheA, partial [bacterium]
TPVKENEKKDAPVPSAKRDDHEIKTMRIEATRLDNFMNLIGELITARNTFNHVTGELGGLKIPGKIMRELKNVETSFNRISDDLQNSLMEMRLVSVKTVFQKIPRMVRDISRKTSKKIQLQMVGEQTAIDKSIVEMLGDPLVHIIRNSCDHGIETPEKRIAAGKPETGTIILKATHLGSAIEIAIIDDGAGINTERVRKLAVEKGMITAEEAEKLDAKTVNNFIFKPGFSTVETVSDLSGRGVGMDVVLTNIQKIQGTVDVDSEPGNGSSVRLTLPLTLAVIDALIISTEGQKFAIPLDAVKETMEVKESTLQHLKQKEAIDVRGKIIGVTQLTHLLELGTKERDPERVWSIVFIQAGGLEIGIAVDDLHTQQEIVVKPLQGYLTNIPGIKGSTILGSGEVVLILEPSELVILAAV